MWNGMRLYGVGGKLLQAVRSFYIGSKPCVRIGNEVSECFPVRVVLRQGCVMSPWLLNFFVDGMVREVNARVLGRGLKLMDESDHERDVNQLLFVHDTLLIADSEENFGRLVRVWKGI
ncbi:uncharacterized protein [Palaemon carinicauda]|uniref:uncharacterized protein n=1 Tax=Palaemon carinicauda TaxID=392227 RepID=UPI0035B67BDC